MPWHNRWAPAFRAMRTACKTRVLTRFPASDDSGLSSQMLCIFFSTHTHTPLSTVLVFSEHMYCRADFMLNSGSLWILKLSHTCLLRKNQKKESLLFFGYILNNRHFPPGKRWHLAVFSPNFYPWSTLFITTRVSVLLLLCSQPVVITLVAISFTGDCQSSIVS